jgi:CDP-diacylglycerol--glycerol-3-phosphate 3-phosphatidyltransferase
MRSRRPRLRRDEPKKSLQPPSTVRGWSVASTFGWLWGGTWMSFGVPMSRTMKLMVRSWAAPLTRALAALGIQANSLTVIGLLLNILAAMLLAAGHFTWGGLFFLVFNAMDFLDGAVARLTGTASDFGAFLDSVVDRYSEAVIFLGLAWWYMGDGNRVGALVTYAALLGSLMVSYTRARAEGLGYACEVGLLPRPERIVLLGLGMIASGVLEAPKLFFFILLALAILTNLTAVQRILHLRRETLKRR